MGCLISLSMDVLKATSPKVLSITLNTPNYIAYVASRVTPFIVNKGDNSDIIALKLYMMEATILS
jgi:hypothetical protein